MRSISFKSSAAFASFRLVDRLGANPRSLRLREQRTRALPVIE
jgi:hypothetical protein